MRRVWCGFSIVTAILVTACVPLGPRAKTRPALRPIAVGLEVALDAKHVETLPDGTTRLANRGPGAFKVVATTNVDRHPYPGESLTAVLTSGERVLRQAPFVFDARHARARFDIPAPGAYRIEIWSDDRFVIGNTFVAASVPSLDGRRTLELHQDASPRLFLTRDETGEQELFGGGVRWMHWDQIDTESGFVAEWWQDGKRVGPAGGRRSEFQREALLQVQIAKDVGSLARIGAFRWTTERFELPDYLPTRPGRWELRIYREDQPSLAFGFDVTPEGAIRGTQRRTIQQGSVELEVSATPLPRSAARQLAKLPGTRFEASKKFLLPVTTAEVRALTRSAELGRLRIRLNRLHQLSNGDPSNAYQFKRDDASPQHSEARKLAAAIQRMIAALGEPWTDAEQP